MTYLQNFYNLKSVPLYLKDAAYISYIESVYQYLLEFVHKSQPLIDHAKFEKEIRTNSLTRSMNRRFIRGRVERWQAGGLGTRYRTQQSGWRDRPTVLHGLPEEVRQ